MGIPHVDVGTNLKFRKREVRKRVEVIVPVYGDIELSEDEMNAAKLPKKFAVYEPVKDEDIRLEKGIGNTKIRWGRRDLTVDIGGQILVDEDIDKTVA